MPGNSIGVTSDLKDKIKSKMDVAKFFAAFISLVIGILLRDGVINTRWSKGGLVFFLFSLGFCVATMSAYDHLLTPKKYLLERYWPELRDASEEAFQDRLAHHMVAAWRFLFLPTLICFGVGFSLVLVQKLRPLTLEIWLGAATGYFLLVLLVMAFLAPTAILFWVWRHGASPAGSDT